MSDNDTPASQGHSATISTRRGSAPRFASSAALVVGMLVVSRLTGFLRGSLLAYYFGQNRMTDAYGYAFTLPDVLWQLVASGALSAAFVPVISEYFAKDDEEGAWRVFSIVFTFLCVILIILVPIVWIFARPLLHLFAPDLTNAMPNHPELAPGSWLVKLPHHPAQVIWPMDLAVQLTRIILPAQVCFFLGSLMNGAQQSLKRFAAPALGPVIYNVGIIAGGVLLHRQLGIEGFAWGALSGAFVGSIVIQTWALRQLHPRFRPSLNLRHPGVKKCGALALPVLLGVSLPQVDQIINGYYVSMISSGRSILDYTSRLMQLPLGIFGQAIGMVILPTLSQHAAQENGKQFREMMSFGVRITLFLTVPASVLMAVLATPLIHVVYQHGAFNAKDTQAASLTLVYYCIGVPAWAAQAIIARGFYALQDTRTPVILGTIVTAFFFVLNGFLVQTCRMGVPGAALATTLAASAHSLILFFLLWSRIHGMNRWVLRQSLRRIVYGSILAGLLSGSLHLLINKSSESFGRSLSDLLISGGTGSLVYLWFQWYMGSVEITRLRILLRQRKNKQSEAAQS